MRGRIRGDMMEGRLAVCMRAFVLSPGRTPTGSMHEDIQTGRQRLGSRGVRDGREE